MREVLLTYEIKNVNEPMVHCNKLSLVTICIILASVFTQDKKAGRFPINLEIFFWFLLLTLLLFLLFMAACKGNIHRLNYINETIGPSIIITLFYIYKMEYGLSAYLIPVFQLLASFKAHRKRTKTELNTERKSYDQILRLIGHFVPLILLVIVVSSLLFTLYMSVLVVAVADKYLPFIIIKMVVFALHFFIVFIFMIVFIRVLLSRMFFFHIMDTARGIKGHSHLLGTLGYIFNNIQDIHYLSYKGSYIYRENSTFAWKYQQAFCPLVYYSGLFFFGFIIQLVSNRLEPLLCSVDFEIYEDSIMAFTDIKAKTSRRVIKKLRARRNAFLFTYTKQVVSTLLNFTSVFMQVFIILVNLLCMPKLFVNFDVMRFQAFLVLNSFFMVFVIFTVLDVAWKALIVVHALEADALESYDANAAECMRNIEYA